MGTLEVTPAIVAAIEELERDFGSLDVEPDDSGGVYVRVHEVDLGERWTPQVVPIELQVPFNYPFAAIYPYYTIVDLASVDGTWPSALQRIEWRGRQVVQISLRSPRWQPAIETAASSLAQVRHWFRTGA